MYCVGDCYCIVRYKEVGVDGYFCMAGPLWRAICFLLAVYCIIMAFIEGLFISYTQKPLFVHNSLPQAT